jgi:hypothetical protein
MMNITGVKHPLACSSYSINAKSGDLFFILMEGYQQFIYTYQHMPNILWRAINNLFIRTSTCQTFSLAPSKEQNLQNKQKNNDINK